MSHRTGLRDVSHLPHRALDAPYPWSPMGESLDVTFFGVRGSTPCPCDENRRYGGNTSCVVLDVPGGEPILFDLGTGLRFYGVDERCGSDPFRATALVSHLHWDHVQGFPSLPRSTARTPTSTCSVPPRRAARSSSRSTFHDPPFFPICYSGVGRWVSLNDVPEGSFDVGPAKVTARRCPTSAGPSATGSTGTASALAYISDHQQPIDDPTRVDSQVLALADGVDLLIHDAQFTPEEFAERPHWGHCTVDYAIEVAHQAGVGELVLFHHDPAHDDDHVDRLLAEARERSVGLDVGPCLGRRGGSHDLAGSV